MKASPLEMKIKQVEDAVNKTNMILLDNVQIHKKAVDDQEIALEKTIKAIDKRLENQQKSLELMTQQHKSSYAEAVKGTYTWWPDDDSVQIASLTAASAVTEDEFRSAAETDEELKAVRGYVTGKWPSRQRDLDPRVSAYYHVRDQLSQHGEKPPLQPIPLPEGPWERLMVDIIGPMHGPPTERYDIVLCNLYSRWPEVALCSDATASTIIQFLETLFAREGLPLELISDNGPAFRSAELRAFLTKCGVRQTFSSPYSPQTCGLVERLNCTIKGAIQSARLAREPRSPYLRRFLGEYRATPHPATGETPFRLMRGREARTALDVLKRDAPTGNSRKRAVRRRHRRYQSAYKRSRRRRAPDRFTPDRYQ
ncbi:uncharacterized protein FJT64_024156 [Amphibalanus amphitrite]|uniref:Integrase catalytic domain-containing protein n=1 Tax=Amphibalanus amphitrite TaxID=1232801 RepID=A0A6A4WMN1_AMPAM|nr:uncharacterized protein FJT64_024156 [Amphibalanus amphitrite]